MPEKNFWNNVKTRLGNYQEVPSDDAWDKIAGALPARSTSSKTKRNLSIILLCMFGTFSGVVLYPSFQHDDAATNISKQVNDVENDNPNTRSAVNNEITTQGKSNSSQVPAPMGSFPDQKSSSNDNTSRHPIVNERNAGKSNTRSANDEYVKTELASSSGAEFQNHRHGQNQSARKEMFSNASGDSENQEKESTSVTTEEKQTTMTNDVMHDGIAHEPLKQVASSEVPNDQSVKAPDEIKIKIDSVQPLKKQNSEHANVIKQEDKPRRHKTFRGNVYAMLTPSLSFQEITPSRQDNIEVIDFESPGVMNKQRFGWSFDAGFQSKLAKKLEWYAGLSYYQQRQTLSYRFKTDEYEVTSTNKGYTMTQKINTRSVSYNMQNIGASAGLFYTIKSGGLEHKFGAGLQFQTGFLKPSQEESYSNSESAYFNYQLSYRLELPIRSRWNIFIQPSFVHAILSREKLKEPFELKPYRAGIGFGAIYRF